MHAHATGHMNIYFRFGSEIAGSWKTAVVRLRIFSLKIVKSVVQGCYIMYICRCMLGQSVQSTLQNLYMTWHLLSIQFIKGL